MAQYPTERGSNMNPADQRQKVIRLLGEKHPGQTANRQAARSALLKKFGLDPTDNAAVADRIERLIKEVTALQAYVLKNPSDLAKRYHLLARITAAVLLAADDEGQHIDKFH